MLSMKNRLLIASILLASTAFAQLPSGTNGSTGGPVPAQTNQVGGADSTNKLRAFKTG